MTDPARRSLAFSDSREPRFFEIGAPEMIDRDFCGVGLVQKRLVRC